MKEEQKFGKSPFNPIRTNGVNESLLYLNSLTTDDNKVILYHRFHTTSIGKSKPIDCYEIFRVGGYKEYLFIDVYANENSNKMPEGYAKAKGIVQPIMNRGIHIFNTISVNYKLRKFPDDLI